VTPQPCWPRQTCPRTRVRAAAWALERESSSPTIGWKSYRHIEEISAPCQSPAT
jgi:hypothetical protein